MAKMRYRTKRNRLDKRIDALENCEKEVARMIANYKKKTSKENLDKLQVAHSNRTAAKNDLCESLSLPKGYADPFNPEQNYRSRFYWETRSEWEQKKERVSSRWRKDQVATKGARTITTAIGQEDRQECSNRKASRRLQAC